MLSYYLNLTSGATIILVSGVAYFISFYDQEIFCEKNRFQLNSVYYPYLHDDK